MLEPCSIKSWYLKAQLCWSASSENPWTQAAEEHLSPWEWGREGIWNRTPMAGDSGVRERSVGTPDSVQLRPLSSLPWRSPAHSHSWRSPKRRQITGRGRSLIIRFKCDRNPIRKNTSLPKTSRHLVSTEFKFSRKPLNLIRRKCQTKRVLCGQ